MIAYCGEGQAVSEKCSMIGDYNLQFLIVKILKAYIWKLDLRFGNHLVQNQIWWRMFCLLLFGFVI